MPGIIESEFESLSLMEKETLLMRQGEFISRRENDGIVIFLYVIYNRFAQISYYVRSHEIIGASLLPGDNHGFESLL